jgi:hypothetical protein
VVLAGSMGYTLGRRGPVIDRGGSVDRVLAEAGFRVIAFPVDIDLPLERKWLDDWLPDAKALVRTDTAVRELIGLAYHRALYRLP